MNEQIASAEKELSHLVVTRTTLARVLAEGDVDEPEFEPGSTVGVGLNDWLTLVRPVVNMATSEVPPEGDWHVLAILASADRPLRAKEICERVEELANYQGVETPRMRPHNAHYGVFVQRISSESGENPWTGLPHPLLNRVSGSSPRF